MHDAKLPEYRLTLPTTNDFQDVFPCVLPFFHIYGFTITLITKLALGCKIVTLPTFQPDTFLTALAEHKATYLNLVPPLVLFLANDPRARFQHLEYVRTIMCGAAPIGALDADRLKEKVPNIEFLQGFGMTESSPVCFLGHRGSTNYATIGWPVASTEAKLVKIDDANFIGLDAEESGEIFVRGPHVMKGYFNDLESTKNAIVDGGWLRSGDIGYYDADGFFYIKDRLKELIKVKGYQVPPAELEELIRDHPKVIDCGVVGVKHPKYGEVPRAFVVVKKGSDVREKDIEEFVASKVSEYKRLTGGVQFMNAIPKSSTGKILRRQLKELQINNND